MKHKSTLDLHGQLTILTLLIFFTHLCHDMTHCILCLLSADYPERIDYTWTVIYIAGPLYFIYLDWPRRHPIQTRVSASMDNSMRKLYIFNCLHARKC